MFHYFDNFSPDDQHFNDFCHSQTSNSCLISSISDYDLGFKEDLFKAPEPIIEQPLITLCGEDILFPENKFTYLESLEDENFMSNPFEEYKDILAKETSSSSEFPDFRTDDSISTKEILYPFGTFTKSMSSDSLISVDEDQMRQISMNFSEMDLNNFHGMRMVSSEGYIKPQVTSDQVQETRMQKLSRYRDKKTKRNFGRKIKYASRKALADGQPRIKGRFAKTEEMEFCRK
ncbi:two-component response regulator-like APRR5 [Lactuca sativa]|uniref:CCT domain-containing protein n=1 Tax=Lactuca sativa TaxID=4236 RepID=A0A9R1UH47_LACSA|nr:two-component response regulator-like APRR5 [Lactuca sativa]KAJ0187081.1 hypothetical protein LSAT_V11C900480260 [Lactuca sativa]